MQIYTRARVAVIVLVDIALLDRGKPVPLIELGNRNNLSNSYLDVVFSRLRAAGIVSSARGPGGGYTIARPLSDIQIADIVEAVDDADESGVHKSPRTTRCFGQGLWNAVNSNAMGYLAKVTLADVVKEERERAGVPHG